MISHDPGAFTQGLEVRNGYLWESTGIYGESSFRRTSIETGEVLDILRLPDSVFAEGFTFLNDSTVILLTWRENTAFVIDAGSMEITGELPLQGEGWGLCLGNGILYQSNGTDTILLHSPQTFDVIGSLPVTLNGQPQVFLNELEYANGYILANQWRTSRILFIDPESGAVERVINLRNAVPGVTGVMNGLAEKSPGELYCSGKNWPVTLILDLDDRD